MKAFASPSITDDRGAGLVVDLEAENAWEQLALKGCSPGKDQPVESAIITVKGDRHGAQIRVPLSIGAEGAEG